MPGGRLRRAVVIAALLCGLGFANWVAATEAIDISARKPSQASAPSLALADVSATLSSKPSLGDLGETLARPLFNDTRRPFQLADDALVRKPVVAPATVAPAPKQTVKLLGTMQVDAETRKALVQSEDVPRAVWVGVGDVVGGWQLVSVANGAVEIEATGTRQQLTLYPAPSSSTGAAR